jgi:aminoglycoside phosphotransferase (APT) family kinase protein
MTPPVRDISTKLEPVRRELDALGHPVADLRPLAAGLEFAVFRAVRDGRAVVVKTPWTRHIANDNDADQDARDLLRQESALLRFARSVGVPAPEVALLHVAGKVDLLVTVFVPNDGSPPDGHELAAILATLHTAPPPALPLVAQPGPFAVVVAERVTRRARVVEQLAGVRLALPPRSTLEATIRSANSPRSLLHLDVRSANLLIVGRRIAGLIDWTNALVGDPALELARIAEYGSAPAGFFEAYERRHPVHASSALELLYRLDAAVMLAVVFLSEAPDPEQVAPRVARARELTEDLRRALDG